MPISVVYDSINRIVRAAAFGLLSRTDAIDFLSEHWAQLNPEWAVLFDASRSTPSYAPSDVLEFVSRTVDVSRGRHPQFAIVAANDERRRIIRQYQLRCEWKGCSTIDVFRTVEDAEAWLRVARQ